MAPAGRLVEELVHMKSVESNELEDEEAVLRHHEYMSPGPWDELSQNKTSECEPGTREADAWRFAPPAMQFK